MCKEDQSKLLLHLDDLEHMELGSLDALCAQVRRLPPYLPIIGDHFTAQPAAASPEPTLSSAPVLHKGAVYAGSDSLGRASC